MTMPMHAGLRRSIATSPISLLQRSPTKLHSEQSFRLLYEYSLNTYTPVSASPTLYALATYPPSKQTSRSPSFHLATHQDP